MASIVYEDEEKGGAALKVKRERSGGGIGGAPLLSFNKPPPRQPKIEILELKVPHSLSSAGPPPCPSPSLPRLPPLTLPLYPYAALGL